jgi:hypothetical protein
MRSSLIYLPSHLQKHVATKAIAAPTAVELQQVLQTETQALQKGLDASIIDIRQAAETFDANVALQQVNLKLST